MNPFAWRLRHARLAKGIDLNELARRCKTSGSVLSNWETGERSPRDMKILRVVVKEIGVRWAWLMDGEQPMFDDGTEGPLTPKWVEGKLSLAQTIASHPKRWSREIIGIAEDASQADGEPEDWKLFLDKVKDEYETRNRPPPAKGLSHAEIAGKRLEAEREQQLLALGMTPAEIAALVGKRPRGRPRKSPPKTAE